MARNKFMAAGLAALVSTASGCFVDGSGNFSWSYLNQEGGDTTFSNPNLPDNTPNEQRNEEYILDLEFEGRSHAPAVQLPSSRITGREGQTAMYDGDQGHNILDDFGNPVVFTAAPSEQAEFEALEDLAANPDQYFAGILPAPDGSIGGTPVYSIPVNFEKDLLVITPGFERDASRPGPGEAQVATHAFAMRTIPGGIDSIDLSVPGDDYGFINSAREVAYNEGEGALLVDGADYAGEPALGPMWLGPERELVILETIPNVPSVAACYNQGGVPFFSGAQDPQRDQFPEGRPGYGYSASGNGATDMCLRVLSPESPEYNGELVDTFYALADSAERVIEHATQQMGPVLGNKL